MDFLEDISSDEDFEIINAIRNRRRPYTVRHRANYYEDLDDVDFFRRFRLTKPSVQYVLNMIINNIQHQTNR